MKSIELDRGWLARQLKEVREEVQTWPTVLAPLRTLNASLAYPSSAPDESNPDTLLPAEISDSQK